MLSIKSRLFMIAIIKDVNKTWGYRLIDRVTKELFHVEVKELKVDTNTHSVFYIAKNANNEIYTVENLHSYKTESGVALKGGMSGQTSKYPMITKRGQLLNGGKSNTLRITLLASYRDKYKFSDYRGKIKYLTAQEVAYAVARGAYILTNSKVVVRNGGMPIISLLYGTLEKEEVLARKRHDVNSHPHQNVANTAIKAQQKSFLGEREGKGKLDKQGVQVVQRKKTPLEELSNVSEDKLVQAINYVQNRLHKMGVDLEYLDAIGIALISCNVYTVEELKDEETFKQVYATLQQCLRNNLSFSQLADRMNDLMFTP